MPGMNGTKSQSPPTHGSHATVAHSTCLPEGARAAFETLLTSISILSKDRVFSTIVDGLQRIPVLEEEIRRNKQEKELQKFSVKEQLDVYNADREAFLNERNALQDDKAASKREIEALLEANRECKLQEASHAARVKELQSSIEAGNMAAQRDAKQIEGLIRAIEVERKKKIELTTLLEEQNAILSKTRDDFETCRQTHEKLRKRADWDAQRLQRAAELTTTLKHNPDTIQGLDDVWRRVSDIVTDRFSEDVAPSAIEAFQAQFQTPGHWGSRLPLPQSNTEAAKQARCVAVMAVMARLFTDIIFQPTHLISSQGEMKQLLVRQARSHPGKEASFRASLLALLPDEQEMASSVVINTACTKIMAAVSGLLSNDGRARFRKVLQDIAEDASDVWREVCSLEECVELSFELSHYKDWNWRHLSFQSGLLQMPELHPYPAAGVDEVLFVVFPRAFSISDPQEDYPETHGALLMASQTAKAREEVECLRLNRGHGRTMSFLDRPTRSRRLSARQNSAGDGPSDTPFLHASSGTS